MGRNWTVPNVLTGLATLSSLGVVWQGIIMHNLMGALIYLAFGGALCILDGVVAEKLNDHTRLGNDVLQPAAGFALGAVAVEMLVFQGYLPIRVMWVLAGIMLFLQFIGSMPRARMRGFLDVAGVCLLAWLGLAAADIREWWVDGIVAVMLAALLAYLVERSWLPRFKRFQFWAHPIFANAVIYAAMVYMVCELLAHDLLERGIVIALSVVLAGLLVVWRSNRFLYWFGRL